MKQSINGPMGPVSVASFNDRPSITEVDLPSRGIPYRTQSGESLFPGGKIRISAMTVAEEKMMSQKNADPSRKVAILLGRVCDLKGMNADQLLVADQFFLLMMVRAISYGNIYTFPFRCEDCGNQWKPSINLETDLSIQVADENWQEPFHVQIDQNKVLAYRLLRVFDEIELHNRKAKPGATTADDITFVAMLARCLISLDGDESLFKNPRMAEAWLEKQSVRTRGAITEDMNSNTPGYSGDLVLTCPSCGFIHEVAVPMTSEFFRPDVSERVVRTSFRD
jgi:rRNA maturation protein Nop10